MYFSCYGHKINIVVSDTIYTFNGTMKHTEQCLEQGSFVRIHQSYIVNMNYVQAFLSNEMQMTNGDRLPISRRYKTRVLKQL